MIIIFSMHILSFILPDLCVIETFSADYRDGLFRMKECIYSFQILVVKGSPDQWEEY